MGRGFIGEILLDAGWAVTFVESAPELVAALMAGTYPHDTVSNAGVHRKVLQGCSAVAAEDVEAVRREVVRADVVFTSVGARNLPRVATALAAGLADRHVRGEGPVDVFLAENIPDGATLMRDLLTSELSHQGLSDADAVLQGVGIVETSIGRMIPVPTPAQRNQHPALVAVEPYRQLPFDLAACRAPVPDVPDLLGREDIDFSFYTDRKLYIHNHGHCLTAYLGMLAAQTEIATSISHPRVAGVVRAAMYAAGSAIAAKHGQPLPSLTAHADDLLERFANTALHDTVERVGRDPQRKLKPHERFLGTLALTAQWGDPSAVLPGVALAAHQLVLSTPGNHHTLTIRPVRDEVSRVTPGLLGTFDALVAALSEGAPLDEFLTLVERQDSDVTGPLRVSPSGG